MYKGQFIKNQISGVGIYRWPDGKVYSGQWLESKMHGEGSLKWKDGSRFYRGQFSNDLRNGYGEYMWAFGTKSYRGQWKDGKQHGIGFVREEHDQTEKKSFWQTGKLIKWLPDGDSDDDEALVTSRMVSSQLRLQESQVNSDDQRNWELSRLSYSGVGMNSPMQISLYQPRTLATTPVVQSNVATQATPNNLTAAGDYVKFDSPKKAQQLPEAMNYILP